MPRRNGMRISTHDWILIPETSYFPKSHTKIVSNLLKLMKLLDVILLMKGTLFHIVPSLL